MRTMKTMNKEQFCEQIRALELSMYRYALGSLKNTADAEDAVSEAVLKAYVHLPDLKKPDRFKSWIMSILANEIRTQMSRGGRMELTEDMSRYQKSASTENRELWRTVMLLPAEFRDVVILYYYEGFRTREIADILDYPEGTVKSRLNRARNQLRRMLEEDA